MKTTIGHHILKFIRFKEVGCFSCLEIVVLLVLVRVDVDSM